MSSLTSAPFSESCCCIQTTINWTPRLWQPCLVRCFCEHLRIKKQVSADEPSINWRRRKQGLCIISSSTSSVLGNPKTYKMAKLGLVYSLKRGNVKLTCSANTGRGEVNRARSARVLTCQWVLVFDMKNSWNFQPKVLVESESAPFILRSLLFALYAVVARYTVCAPVRFPSACYL